MTLADMKGEDEGEMEDEGREEEDKGGMSIP